MRLIRIGENYINIDQIVQIEPNNEAGRTKVHLSDGSYKVINSDNTDELVDQCSKVERRFLELKDE